MSLFQVEKTLLWTLGLEVLWQICLSNKKVFLSIEHIMPESLYACSYDDDERYFGVANYISVENYDVNIKFLQPNGAAARFFRPSH